MVSDISRQGWAETSSPVMSRTLIGAGFGRRLAAPMQNTNATIVTNATTFTERMSFLLV